ncbi:hypothetical protein G5V59_23315 [Nocardioides sp. W3-2-3]|uniref:hypothetical protein n=1 Tax=Nocardioides convexus TaxID=2712224 RepID=UPI002418B833|nr:hypothetical protein [Nocardioides convexus]NHA01676.1 hypothetical protein [Nocardioides convexus]
MAPGDDPAPGGQRAAPGAHRRRRDRRRGRPRRGRRGRHRLHRRPAVARPRGTTDRCRAALRGCRRQRPPRHRAAPGRPGAERPRRPGLAPGRDLRQLRG